MATDPKQTPFARDIGYLDAFFDKLEAHASGLPAAAGARLRTLVGEERQRWAEIVQLLARPEGTVARAESSASGTSSDDGTPSAPPEGRTFTVGPLRGR